MRHVYLHVPFCQRRCSYCDFAIAVRRRVPARDYVEAIGRELALVRIAGGAAGAPEPGVGPLETLYLGGGTPSLLPPEALTALVEAVRSGADSAPPGDLELTLEANPDDVTVEHATAWRRAGVNRVSLGAQSFDDRVLQWMHRTHDAARIGQAVAALRAAGIENLSLDLIFALPAELERDWTRDLEHALALAPLHLSLYGLTVEERTPLARWISRGRTAAPNDERYAAEYLLAHERLGREGYQFYEVSNATRPGGRSRHNAVYWSGRPYLGLGPAAHSFDGRARRWNTPAWETYRGALALGRSPVASEEVLTEAERELERVYLALRTDAGLVVGPGTRQRASVARWVAAGWARERGDRVVLSPEGWLRLDALVGDLTGAPGTS
ncbi:MAG TPA: radical SAM family heme chaperone HemW [Gemmatimonadales bacterium]|jgi:oxygen-independent coproporphyrinogen-3 oxidase|nr:radical SAM family heme chaperone HemW [Gemmatimonadales bacterium]